MKWLCKSSIEKTQHQELDPLEFIKPEILTKKELYSEILSSDVDGVFLKALFLESQLS